MEARVGRIGKYEVLRPLATGGMAELFVARDTALTNFERLVVIKRVRPQLAHDPKYVSMFLDEARLTATLQHPNVVQVYDFGEDQDGYYVVMEYLHGEDLARVMKAAARDGHRLPLEHAISIVIGMCSALHHAHERVTLEGKPLHIVHRDVSPHNVEITYDGGVKVVDFGIAKAEGRQHETQNGTVKGKLAYMSPEQCRGEPVDRRSDVFSISIILWELTTGQRLFEHVGPYDLLRQVVEAPLRTPSQVVRNYPRELEAIVMRGLNRSVQERLQTAEELQLELEAFARQYMLAVSPVGLARYMRELFLPTVTAWRAAQHEGATAITHFVLDELSRRSAEPEDKGVDHGAEDTRPVPLADGIDAPPTEARPKLGSGDPLDAPPTVKGATPLHSLAEGDSDESTQAVSEGSAETQVGRGVRPMPESSTALYGLTLARRRPGRREETAATPIDGGHDETIVKLPSRGFWSRLSRFFARLFGGSSGRKRLR